MSKPKTRGNLPTTEEVIEGMGLKMLGADESPSGPVGLPAWVGEPEGVPMPAALTVELGARHQQRDAANAEVARIEAERSALFRGFLVGAGLSLTATYDLSTGRVTVPGA
jgi:hypothetical protein